MSEFKINLQPTDRGFLRADFTDCNGEECLIQESSIPTEECIWLGCNSGTHHHVTGDCMARMHLTREMAATIGRVLTRFALRGTLAEPTPEQQLANVRAAFREIELLDMEKVKSFETDFRLALVEDDSGDCDMTDKDIDRIVSIATASLEHILMGANKTIDILQDELARARARAEDAEGRIANALI